MVFTFLILTSTYWKRYSYSHPHKMYTSNFFFSRNIFLISCAWLVSKISEVFLYVYGWTVFDCSSSCILSMSWMMMRLHFFSHLALCWMFLEGKAQGSKLTLCFSRTPWLGMLLKNFQSWLSVMLCYLFAIFLNFYVRK